jgi:hypothetical protein
MTIYHDPRLLFCPEASPTIIDHRRALGAAPRWAAGHQVTGPLRRAACSAARNPRTQALTGPPDIADLAVAFETARRGIEACDRGAIGLRTRPSPSIAMPPTGDPLLIDNDGGSERRAAAYREQVMSP